MSTTSSAGLHIQSLRVHRERSLLVSIDTRIAPGEIVTVMGPSGSGKSTLLSVIVGTPAPAFRVSGRILLDGRDITGLPPEQRHVGILFQDDVLFPHLSVAGNLAFGLPSHVRGRRARRARVEAALVEADLAGFADRDPATLSGGQRVRIALLRMLLSEPRALLLDEPFSKLDANLRNQVRTFVFREAADRNLPVLLVTHDEEDAIAAGGRIIAPIDPGLPADRRETGDGIVQEGDIAVPAPPHQLSVT